MPGPLRASASLMLGVVGWAPDGLLTTLRRSHFGRNGVLHSARLDVHPDGATAMRPTPATPKAFRAPSASPVRRHTLFRPFDLRAVRWPR